jgi:hypothetical protein
MRIFEIIVSKPLSNGSLVADREQRLSAYSYYPFAQADADLGANLWISHWNAPPIAPERRWSDPMKPDIVFGRGKTICLCSGSSAVFL